MMRAFRDGLTFLLFCKVTYKSPSFSLGQVFHLALKFFLQPQLLLSARLRGVDDLLIASAALGANSSLFDANVAQNVVGGLHALFGAPSALGRLRQRLVLPVPATVDMSVQCSCSSGFLLFWGLRREGVMQVPAYLIFHSITDVHFGQQLATTIF